MSSSFFESLNPIKHIVHWLLTNKYVHRQKISKSNLLNITLENLSLNCFNINQDILNFSDLKLESANIRKLKISLESYKRITVSVESPELIFYSNEDLPPSAFMEGFIERMVYLSAEEMKEGVTGKKVNTTLLGILSRLSFGVVVKGLKIKVKITRPVFHGDGLFCPGHELNCGSHCLQVVVKKMRIESEESKGSKGLRDASPYPESGKSEYGVYGSNSRKSSRSNSRQSQKNSLKHLSARIIIEGMRVFREVRDIYQIQSNMRRSVAMKQIPILLFDQKIEAKFRLGYSKNYLEPKLSLSMKDIALVLDSHNILFLATLIAKLSQSSNARLALKYLNSFKEEKDLDSKEMSIIYQFNQSLINKSGDSDHERIISTEASVFNQIPSGRFKKQRRGARQPTSSNSPEGTDRANVDFGASQSEVPDLQKLQEKCEMLLENHKGVNDSDNQSLLGLDFLNTSVSDEVFSKYHLRNLKNMKRKKGMVRKNKVLGRQKANAEVKVNFSLQFELENFYFAYVSNGISDDISDLLSYGKEKGYLKLRPLKNIQIKLSGIKINLRSRTPSDSKINSSRFRNLHEERSFNRSGIGKRRFENDSSAIRNEDLSNFSVLFTVDSAEALVFGGLSDKKAKMNFSLSMSLCGFKSFENEEEKMIFSFQDEKTNEGVGPNFLSQLDPEVIDFGKKSNPPVRVEVKRGKNKEMNLKKRVQRRSKSDFKKEEEEDFIRVDRGQYDDDNPSSEVWGEDDLETEKADGDLHDDFEQIVGCEKLFKRQNTDPFRSKSKTGNEQFKKRASMRIPKSKPKKPALTVFIQKNENESEPSLEIIFGDKMRVDLNGVILGLEVISHGLNQEISLFKNLKPKFDSLIRKGSVENLRSERELFFANYFLTDFTLMETYIFEFLKDSGVKEITLTSLLEIFRRVEIPGMKVSLAVQEAVYNLEIGEIFLRREEKFGDLTRSKENDDFSSRLARFFQKTGAESVIASVLDTSITREKSKYRLKFGVSGVTLEFFSNLNEEKADLGVSVKKVSGVLCEYLHKNRPGGVELLTLNPSRRADSLDLKIESVKFNLEWEGVMRVMSNLAGLGVELQTQQISQRDIFDKLRKLFVEKYSKMNINQKMKEIHLRLAEVVNRVLEVDICFKEMKIFCDKILVDFVSEKLTEESGIKYEPRISRIIKKKDDGLLDVTDIFQSKSAMKELDAIKYDDVLGVKFELDHVQFEICKQNEEFDFGFKSLDLHLYQIPEPQLFETIFFLNISNPKLKSNFSNSPDHNLSLEKIQVYFDLCESRLKNLQTFILDAINRLKHLCKQSKVKELLTVSKKNSNVKNKFRKSDKRDPHDMKIRNSQNTFQSSSGKSIVPRNINEFLESVSFNLRKLDVVINEYGFSYIGEGQGLGVKNASVYCESLKLHRADYMETKKKHLEAPSELFGISAEMSSSQPVLKISQMMVNMKKLGLKVDDVELLLTESLIRERDLYADKIESLKLLFESFHRAYGNGFLFDEKISKDKVPVISDVASIENDLGRGMNDGVSVDGRTVYKSIYQSFSPGQSLKGRTVRSDSLAGSNENEMNREQKEDGFEIINPNDPKLFESFKNFSNNANKKFNVFEAEDLSACLEQFCKRQEGTFKNIWRLYVTNFRVFLRMESCQFNLLVHGLNIWNLKRQKGETRETQMVVSCMYLRLKNKTHNCVLINSEEKSSFLDMLWVRDQSGNARFAIHLAPLHLYLASIKKSFRYIYRFFMGLNADAESRMMELRAREETNSLFSRLKTSLSSSTSSESRRRARELNDVLTESLPYLAENDQFHILGDEESTPESGLYVVDFRVGSLELNIHRGKKESRRVMRIKTKEVSPLVDIRFDQSFDSVLKLVSKSLKRDLWKNKGKFMNLSTLNFLLLLVNVVYTIMFSSKKKKSGGRIRRKSLKDFDGSSSFSGKVIGSFKKNIFSMFGKKK